MRLIDADELRQIIDDEVFGSGSRNYFNDVISATPTIDAVPVVRCKDCKHQEPSETVTADTTLCMEFVEIVDMDGFCYMGERREDGEA